MEAFHSQAVPCCVTAVSDQIARRRASLCAAVHFDPVGRHFVKTSVGGLPGRHASDRSADLADPEIELGMLNCPVPRSIFEARQNVNGSFPALNRNFRI
jgi:hypothetical protein